MPKEPTIAAVEQQMKDHGFTIKTSVNNRGVATVKLSDSFNGNEFVADSGEAVGRNRYAVALFIAAERALDYLYRSKSGERPELGSSRWESYSPDA